MSQNVFICACYACIAYAINALQKNPAAPLGHLFNVEEYCKLRIDNLLARSSQIKAYDPHFHSIINIYTVCTNKTKSIVFFFFSFLAHFCNVFHIYHISHIWRQNSMFFFVVDDRIYYILVQQSYCIRRSTIDFCFFFSNAKNAEKK